MRDVTESELARMEAQDNEMEQATLNLYLKDPKVSEDECDILDEIVSHFHWHHAGMVLCAAMSRLHTKIGYQTGKLFTGGDTMEEGGA